MHNILKILGPGILKVLMVSDCGEKVGPWQHLRESGYVSYHLSIHTHFTHYFYVSWGSGRKDYRKDGPFPNRK